MLRGEHGAQRAELTQLVEGLRDIRPDVVNLPDLLLLGVARELKAVLRVPVVCTLTGEDIFLDAMVEPYRGEANSLIRERAVEVDAFVAVTRYFAEHSVTRFALPRDRVQVVPMGIDAADIAEREREPEGVFTIGYFARVCPEKGLWNLCEAFVRLRRAGRDCRLRAGGYVGDRAYLERVRGFVGDQGVSDRFEYVGELDRAGKFEFLQSLHVFSVPTVYHEAKGLYVLEAMACGVPVVQPRHGSFPELVEATGGGVLYDPGDPAALADSIGRLMDDAALRVRLGKSGGVAVRASFNDRIMADRTWEVYERLVTA
jgi:glycosyltransferase involved in cell wall biosynthesis